MQECPEDVDAAAGQGEDGLDAVLALGTFTVVEPAGVLADSDASPSVAAPGLDGRLSQAACWLRAVASLDSACTSRAVGFSPGGLCAGARQPPERFGEMASAPDPAVRQPGLEPLLAWPAQRGGVR